MSLTVADLKKYDELVAAQAGDQIVGRCLPRSRSADRAQQLIADRMAERVVDLLELVEIDEQHRGPRWRGPRELRIATRGHGIRNGWASR